MNLKTQQTTILVVDDVPQNVHILNSILGPHYRVKVALNGESALKIAQARERPDLILLDVVMPGLDGYEVCRRLKADPTTTGIPVIFVTGMGETDDEAKGFAAGAVDYITKPVSPPIVLARVLTHLELKDARDLLEHQNAVLEQKVEERTQELALTQQVTIQSLASLAETRDNETGGHIRRTQNYVRLLAEHLAARPSYASQLQPDVVELLHRSAPLHDIGKVGVPDAILLKPGKLTEDEFAEMKKHTIYGKEAIERAQELFQGFTKSDFLILAREISYTHHEKWDGTGYPQGLAGEAIQLSGRLMALADVYDALISRRVYKPPFPHSKALAILAEGRGTHFDPVLVDVFLSLREEVRSIALEFTDHDEEREALQA